MVTRAGEDGEAPRCEVDLASVRPRKDKDGSSNVMGWTTSKNAWNRTASMKQRRGREGVTEGEAGRNVGCGGARSRLESPSGKQGFKLENLSQKLRSQRPRAAQRLRQRANSARAVILLPKQSRAVPEPLSTSIHT